MFQKLEVFELRCDRCSEPLLDRDGCCRRGTRDTLEWYAMDSGWSVKGHYLCPRCFRLNQDNKK